MNKYLILTLTTIFLIFLVGTAVFSFSALLSNDLSITTKFYYFGWGCMDCIIIYIVSTFFLETVQEKYP